MYNITLVHYRYTFNLNLYIELMHACAQIKSEALGKSYQQRRAFQINFIHSRLDKINSIFISSCICTVCYSLSVVHAGTSTEQIMHGIKLACMLLLRTYTNDILFFGLYVYRKNHVQFVHVRLGWN